MPGPRSSARANAVAAAGRHGVRPQRHLPTWPLYALFVGYPVWWLLGLGSFALAILAVPMLIALVLRGDVRLPRHFWLWLVFIAFMLTSVVAVDSALRILGFLMRAGNLVGATVILVYLFNIPRDRLPTRRVVYALLAFWAYVVAGGFLGLLFPGAEVRTPLSRVLPGSVLANEYVQELVFPSFAEVQTPFGAETPFVRPSAPFAYTNGWGCAYALMLPVVLLAIQQAGRGWLRRSLVVVLAASSVPALSTLNRGMFLAVAVSMTYVAVRLAVRGQVRLLGTVVAVAAGGVVAASALDVQARLAERLMTSGTNSTRLALYQEAFVRTLGSPVLGHGAPRPSEVVDVSVGTQGQVWNVMFSFGFVALVAYVGWFWISAWNSRDARDPTRLWLHVVVVVASFTIFYYGYDGIHTSIVMVAIALLVRPATTEGTAGAAVPGAPRARSDGRTPDERLAPNVPVGTGATA